MFLSEYNFQLDYAPGKKSPTDFPSHRPNFSPKEGDEVLHNQNKLIFTDHHLKLLFPLKSLNQPPISISTLSTFNLDNSELLNEFKDNFWKDIEWRNTLSNNDESFSVQNDIIFMTIASTFLQRFNPKFFIFNMILYYQVILDAPGLMTLFNMTFLGQECKGTSVLMLPLASNVNEPRIQRTNLMVCFNHLTFPIVHGSLFPWISS